MARHLSQGGKTTDHQQDVLAAEGRRGGKLTDARSLQGRQLTNITNIIFALIGTWPQPTPLGDHAVQLCMDGMTPQGTVQKSKPETSGISPGSSRPPRLFRSKRPREKQGKVGNPAIRDHRSQTPLSRAPSTPSSHQTALRASASSRDPTGPTQRHTPPS